MGVQRPFAYKSERAGVRSTEAAYFP